MKKHVAALISIIIISLFIGYNVGKMRTIKLLSIERIEGPLVFAAIDGNEYIYEIITD